MPLAKLAAQFFLIASAMLALGCGKAELSDVAPNVSNAILIIDQYTSPCENKNDDDRTLCVWVVNEILEAEFPVNYLKNFTYVAVSVDLNSDGKAETLVRIPPETRIGGTSGYPIYVLSDSGDKFQTLLLEDAWLPLIKLKTKTRGWNDLAIQVGGGGADWAYNIFKFDGMSYQGSGFQKNAPDGEILLNKDHGPSFFGPVPAH